MAVKENIDYLKENFGLRPFLLFFRNFFLTILLFSPLFIYVGLVSLNEILIPNDKSPFTIWSGKDPKTEIIITWETTQPEASHVWLGSTSGSLEFRPESDDQEVNIHRVEISGLHPGTKYYYKVGVNSDPLVYRGGMSTFTTAPKTSNVDFNFALYSDSQQIFGLGWHDKIGRALGSRNDLAFVGNVGDLCQEWNCQEDWNQFFQEGQPFMGSTVFVPIIGNHDGYYPDDDPEGDDHHYLRYFGTSSGYSIADANEPLFNYAFSYSNAHFLIAEISKGGDEDPTVLRNKNHDIWMNATLAENQDKTFRVLMFHRQVFSSCGMNDRLINRIVPIAEKYNVSIVFYGHHHHYERFLYNGITYVDLGGGGVYQTDSGFNPSPYTRIINIGPSYTFVSVNVNNMTVQTLSPDNDVIDSFVLQAQNNKAVLIEEGGVAL